MKIETDFFSGMTPFHTIAKATRIFPPVWVLRTLPVWMLILVQIFSYAETYNVVNLTDFQNSLIEAASNGEHDVINIAAGTFSVSSTLTFVSNEDFTLTISGVSSSQTILDGGSSIQLLNLASMQNNSHLIIEKMNIRNGQTSANGGALSVETSTANITIRNCEIHDCQTTGPSSLGGGASLITENGTITVQYADFRRNHSSANVGGLYAAALDGTIQISESTFQDNTVNNTGGSTYYGDGGGAMCYTDSSGHAQVTGCTFQGNETTGGDNPDAGGLMVYQLGTNVSAEITGNTFRNNRAGLGGGGCFIRMNGSGSAICSQNEIIDNVALIDAGGGAFLYVETGTIICEGNTITGNTAGGNGAGLWVQHGSGSVGITDNTINNNASTENGAGANIYSESGTITLTGNQFSENLAGGVGGGISFSTAMGTVNMSNNTFSSNTADEGGGIYCYFENATQNPIFDNLIMWNDAPNEFAYSYGSAAPSIALTYSDIKGASSESWFGVGCIDRDPLFVDASNQNFHLSWENDPDPDSTRSPCIDTGNPASTLDPDGTRVDMGAFAYAQGAVIQPTFSRMINHVTSATGGFQTTVYISHVDLAGQQADVYLYPSTANGERLDPIHLTMKPNTYREWLSTDLFMGLNISHFTIDAPKSCFVSVGYRIANGEGATAHVNEKGETGTSFLIYPGEQGLVFDGLALVNLGENSSNVAIELLDTNGQVLTAETIQASLAPNAKCLQTFDNYDLTDVVAARVTSSQTSSVLFLRGSRPGITPGYLFQVLPIPLDQAGNLGSGN